MAATTKYDERSQEIRTALGPRGERFPGDALRADGGRGPRFPGDDNLDDQRNDETLRRGGPTGERGAGRSSGEGGDASGFAKAYSDVLQLREELAKSDLSPFQRRQAERSIDRADYVVQHAAAERSLGYRRKHKREMENNPAARAYHIARLS